MADRMSDAVKTFDQYPHPLNIHSDPHLPTWSITKCSSCTNMSRTSSLGSTGPAAMPLPPACQSENTIGRGHKYCHKDIVPERGLLLAYG